MIDGMKIVDVIDSYEWVEPVADVVAGTVKTTLDSAGPASPTLKNFLHGTWLGHPLHPVLTDIPLGAWTVAAALDTAEMAGCKAAAPGADAAVFVGFLGALASAVTGLADWHLLQPGEKSRKVGTVHAALNIGATLLYGGSILLRKSKHRGLARILAGVGYGLVGTSAYLGGILVYDQKLGVDHAPREGYTNDWVEVMAEADLASSKPTAAKAGEIDIVLYREGGSIWALANSCSHLGGPLCEGEVKDGAIVCPWHQSAFDLKTGAVTGAPATFRQPAFETRTRNGQIEVKPSKLQPTAAYSID